jgi:DNA-binding MarR family transcriptional regulator
MSQGPPSRTLIDPLAGNPISALQRASMVTLGALTASFDALGLRVIDAATLRLIAANPGCNQAEIGRTLGVQRTNMVPIVAGLVDAGLVERRIADGRTHALHLTTEGKALHKRFLAAAEKVHARFFGAMDADVRAGLDAALQEIREKES